MWQAVQRGHYFINLSEEESDHRTDTLMSGGTDLVWMLRGTK
jgi:hypothetical protein